MAEPVLARAAVDKDSGRVGIIPNCIHGSHLLRHAAAALRRRIRSIQVSHANRKKNRVLQVFERRPEQQIVGDAGIDEYYDRKKKTDPRHRFVPARLRRSGRSPSVSSSAASRVAVPSRMKWSPIPS
jgi:hypothetical protein